MEGGKIYSDMKREYHAQTALECAQKCNEERDFTCRYVHLTMTNKGKIVT